MTRVCRGASRRTAVLDASRRSTCSLSSLVMPRPGTPSPYYGRQSASPKGICEGLTRANPSHAPGVHGSPSRYRLRLEPNHWLFIHPQTTGYSHFAVMVKWDHQAASGGSRTARNSRQSTSGRMSVARAAPPECLCSRETSSTPSFCLVESAFRR